MLAVMQYWVGWNEVNGKHKEIIDIYNSVAPLPINYTLQYTDSWCDTTVSAASIMAGCTALTGRECGVNRHIDIFKKKGIWKENGRIRPKAGWLIVYSWLASSQPNNSWGTHIGIVEKVDGDKITTIEGNFNDKVCRRTIPVGWGFIRGYAAPEYV